MSDISLCCKDNTPRKKVFAKPRKKKIWRYNDSSLFVTTKWLKGKFPLLTSLGCCFMRPKKIKGLFALLACKIGRVGRSILFFFLFFFLLNLYTWEMQYHLCVCILGHAEPQNWFCSSIGGGYIPLYLVKAAFWGQILYILTFYFNIFVRKYKIEN